MGAEAHGVSSAVPDVATRSRLRPLRCLGCVVDIHYTWDCLQQLVDARHAGHHISVASVILPEGTEEELVALALAVVSDVFIIPRQLFIAEFGQDASWQEQTKEGSDTSHSTGDCSSESMQLPLGTRSPWRRFEGGGSRGTCRYAVACPISVPLEEMRPPLVVLDGLTSSSNVGQILRSAFHLGVTSVVASRTCWSCLNGRACRVSMGWMYQLKFHLADSLPATLKCLQSRGVHVYGAENYFAKPVGPHKPVGSCKWALVVGSEGDGLSPEVVAACDECICVPQRQGKSLNVAHATSICLYELSKHNVMQGS